MISYFHVLRHHPETAHWFRTLAAPLLGGLGMVYVVYLLAKHASFAAGTASNDWVFTAIPGWLPPPESAVSPWLSPSSTPHHTVMTTLAEQCSRRHTNDELFQHHGFE